MTTNDEEEDDYLTMTLAEPERGPETYSQRRARKLREHETNSHIKPIKELEKERRDEGLDKNLFEDRRVKETKAMRIMKMMGYQYVVLLRISANRLERARVSEVKSRTATSNQ